jgi:hypothetical protein
MWHQNGSDEWMHWSEAKKWFKKLNKSGYAGYRDWRLPTVDEAVSLLESGEKNGDLYIDPVFSKKQRWILTGDKFEDEDGLEAAWFVVFNIGIVCCYYSSDINDVVRPVRSME